MVVGFGLLRTTFRQTAQNFALFLPFPATVPLFLCLSGCVLVEFWWCLRRRNPKMCMFGLSGCRVKPAGGGKREERMKIWAGEAPPPFKAPPFGAPPFGAPPFGCLFFHALLFHFVVLFFLKKKAKRLKHQFGPKLVWPKSASAVQAASDGGHSISG